MIRRLPLILCAALLLLGACAAPEQGPQPTAPAASAEPGSPPTAAATSTPVAPTTDAIPVPSPTATATAATSTPTPSAGAIPVATPTPSSGAATQFEELGVRFAYDPSLASAIDAQTVPAATGDQAPPWAIFPEHRQFTLGGYPVQGAVQPPTIRVFPVDAYAAASPDAQQSIDALRTLLAEQPAAPESIPVLPLLNAAQVIRAQVRYLPFQGGTGVRFVAHYTQNVAPVTNEGIFYVFQGITGDGMHYVSAFLPVSAAVLDPSSPDAVPFPTPDPSGVGGGEASQRYLADVARQLDALEPSGYTPNLEQLDALVQSIEAQ
jgi:hypothetical protein